MKIDNQRSSGSIYNITGDFNGDIKAENIYLNHEGVGQELVRPSQDILHIQFGINYIDDLQSEQAQKKLITSSCFIRLQHVLNNCNEVAIIGNPGVGKTCILYQLSLNRKDVIYVNLKNKSLQIVLLHLINKYNISAGVPLIDKIDIDSGLELLQGLFIHSSQTFLLDECENSTDILERILPLKKHQNTFVYASQSRTEFDTEQIEVVSVGNFDEYESKEFLKKYGIELDVLSFNELLETSQGNALYLYYFSQYSVTPFPKGIEQYHLAIWKQLDTIEKECVIYVTLAHFQAQITDISHLLFSDELQKTVELVDRLRLINRLTEGRIEVFHPAFKNYVVDQTKSDGTLDTYKKRLGQHFRNNKDFVQAAYLLIDIQPEAIEDFGFKIIPEIYNNGEFEFCNKIAFFLLKKKRDPSTEGYLKFCIYQNKRFIQEDHNYELIDDAIRLFAEAGNQKLHTSARMNKAMDLIESGRVDQGRELVDSIISEDDGTDPEQTGALLVSLSKIYIDLHQYKMAADSCKKAFDIFTVQENLYGMVSSMVNLASSLNRFDGYRDLSRKYAHKILDLKLSDYYFGVELIALNVLTSVYRQMKKYDDAKKYGALAVQQSQKFKLFKKAILNLINYGNIFRDTGEIEEAIKIYEEALLHAVEMNIHKEQSRIHWIMSDIFVEKGDLEKGMELINNSIESAKEVNYQYGIAHGHKERASIWEAKKELLNAAVDFEEAFDRFSEMEGMVKEAGRCLTNAILLYMKIGERVKLERLIRLSIGSFGGGDFINLIGIADYEENNVDIHSYFDRLNKKYIEIPSPNNQVLSYLDYLKYCKDNIETSKKFYKNIVLGLCEGHQMNSNRLAVLAILIEQSDRLFQVDDLIEIISVIKANIKGLAIRKTVNEIVFLSMDPNGFNLEINVHQEDPLGIKLCLAFLFFRYAIPDFFILNEEDLKEKYVKIYFHEFAVFKEVVEKRRGLPIGFNEDQQFRVINFEQAGIPLTVVIGEDYKTKSDLILFSENKCFMFLLRSLGCEIISHFYKKNISEVYSLTKSITARIGLLYGYTNVEDDAEKEFDYNLDLSKIENLISE